ncbi:MAG: dTDP-4-dehydrorhamnose reductase [Patescibacteria group bacterium]
MPKIILTGSDGMLGKALKKALSASFDLHAFPKAELDITNSAAVEKVFSEIKPDFCVNAAGYTQVDRAESEQELAMRLNGEAVGLLGEECKKVGAKLIHFSTDYVFDGETKAGYLENAKPNPINFYGKSKLAGEQMLRESGCAFVIIRTSWLCGEGECFVSKMLELARRNSTLKVVADQQGSPTFTADLAEATSKIIQKNLSGVFHRTNDGIVTWADFAKKIFEIKKLGVKVIPIKTAEFPTPAARPANSVLLNTKLPPLRKWEEGLRGYLKQGK